MKSNTNNWRKVKDASTSPFAYAANNPVLFNDPLGLVVDVTGYSDYQLRALYRANRGNYGNFGDWAQDNLDFSGAGGADRIVGDGNGNFFGVNAKGEFGQYKYYENSYQYADGVEAQWMGTYVTREWVPYEKETQTGNGPSSINQHYSESISLSEFLDAIKGLPYDDVVDQIQGRNASKTRLDSQPSGPELRYVRNPHDNNVIDMRHMLVVGFRFGSILGAALEFAQLFDKSSRGSALNSQDFYSNTLGSNFGWFYYFDVRSNPSKLSDYLSQFFEKPSLSNRKIF